MPRFARLRPLFARLAPFAAALAPGLSAQTAPAPIPLSAEIVSAARLPQPREHLASAGRVYDRADLAASPAATLDGALRALPAFSLFRRSDSFSANPTAQGVSLRGLGPSGASRSLVLLDDVPLNDPFGVWVAWTKLPRESLARIEVVPGGGATAWGNAALGGVVHLLSAAPETTSGSATVTAGDAGTRSAEVAATLAGGTARLDLDARAFGTDGYVLVAPERRGAIDLPAWSRHRSVHARWRQPLAPDLHLALAVRSAEEKRGNGTPYQRNASRENFAAVTLAGQPDPAFAWTAVAYGQDQRFASTFSGVNATRTAETPASDQFAVPAVALGAALTGSWRHADRAVTSVGADTRRVRGETREHFTFTAGNFTRLRVAGGTQNAAGLFALHERPLTAALRATAGLRLDRWTDTAGHRRESDRATGVASRDERYPSLSDTELSPSAGLVWSPAPAWRLRAHAQNSFRRPTLNELHRPFRVGANVTEANAALRTEHARSAELGAEWTLTESPRPPQSGEVRLDYFLPPPPRPLLTLSATAFANDLRDAVGNVTLARGPGTFPVVGTLAAGALGRQRLNLDRTRVQGLEFSARWTPRAALTVTADALLNDATVRRAAVAPALVGKRVAQVPRRTAALGATWRAPGRFVVTPRLRYLGRQFEDDENQLVLGAAVVADLSVSRPLTHRLEVFISAENLGDTRLETGRSADGVVNVASPRLVLAGLRGRW